MNVVYLGDAAANQASHAVLQRFTTANGTVFITLVYEPGCDRERLLGSQRHPSANRPGLVQGRATGGRVCRVYACIRMLESKLPPAPSMN